MLVLYGTQLAQSLLLSMFIGLYASSFDWFKRDALVVGMLLYVFAQAVPIVVAMLAYFSGKRVFVDAHPLLLVGLELGSLLLIALLRELIIMLLRQALRGRLNSSREPAGQRGVAAVHGVG